MNPKPIALLEPVLGNVMAGTCRRLRRAAGGTLDAIQPGDRLWIRELYHLNARFDALRPSAAVREGAWPAFAHEFWRKPKPAGLGKRRMARELLREWHRHHLLVTAVERQRLQDITAAEAAAEGYRTRHFWAIEWDRNAFVHYARNRWEDNPAVVVFDFEYVAAPLPAVPKPAPRPRVRTPGPAPGRAPQKPPMGLPLADCAALKASTATAARARTTADGRTWCDQCERRVAPQEGRTCAAPFCRLAERRIA
jgi:hypothetical protein